MKPNPFPPPHFNAILTVQDDRTRNRNTPQSPISQTTRTSASPHRPGKYKEAPLRNPDNDIARHELLQHKIDAQETLLELRHEIEKFRK
jgi:hypothetical protein